MAYTVKTAPSCLTDALTLFPHSYAQYSVIAARALRQALKEPMKSEAAKRDGSQIKIFKWKDGKALSKGTLLTWSVLLDLHDQIYIYIYIHT